MTHLDIFTYVNFGRHCVLITVKEPRKKLGKLIYHILLCITYRRLSKKK